MYYGRFYMQSSDDKWIIEHITWKLDAEKSSLPEFDSSEESAGAVYIYTPTIPETDENGNHYILSEEAILPEIYQSRQKYHVHRSYAPHGRGDFIPVRSVDTFIRSSLQSCQVKLIKLIRQIKLSQLIMATKKIS